MTLPEADKLADDLHRAALERRREQPVDEALDPRHKRPHSARREHLRDELPQAGLGVARLEQESVAALQDQAGRRPGRSRHDSRAGCPSACGSHRVDPRNRQSVRKIHQKNVCRSEQYGCENRRPEAVPQNAADQCCEECNGRKPGDFEPIHAI
jgi:hypothetical protein